MVDDADLLSFAQDLVRIKSYSGQEEQIARFIAAKMEALGFDEVKIDRFGNVLGRVGSGAKVHPFRFAYRHGRSDGCRAVGGAAV